MSKLMWEGYVVVQRFKDNSCRYVTELMRGQPLFYRTLRGAQALAARTVMERPSVVEATPTKAVVIPTAEYDRLVANQKEVEK